jgi:hypothetical protein
MKQKKTLAIKKPKCSCCRQNKPIEQSYNGNGVLIELCKNCNKCKICGAHVDIIKRFMPVKHGNKVVWESSGAEPLCKTHYNELRKEETKNYETIGKLPMP